LCVVAVGYGIWERTVDVHAGVADNLLDLAVGLEVSESLAGKAAVDLETVDKGGDGDQTVGLNILLELLGGRLVENDGVLGLVLDCRRNISQYSVLSYPTIPLVDGSEIVTVAWMEVAYPCPWTTSSFASCHR
jgi:hypothetical protein